MLGQIKFIQVNINTSSVIHKPESKSKSFYFSCSITIYIKQICPQLY